MGRVVVMTDSVACLPRDLAKELEIKVVPAANIMFGGQNYIDGETITAEQAYEFIKKDPDSFITSAITPAYLLKAYRELSASSDEILFITLSSALSAVFKTASAAAELFQQEFPNTTVRVVDSRAVASTQGLVVWAVARAAAAGKSLEELTALTEEVRQKTHGVMLLDTLRYVYRTGRMSKTASKVLSLLNIRPINRLSQEGTIELVDRARKRTDGIQRLLNLIGREAGTDSLHFMLTHAAAPEMAEGFIDLLSQRYHCLSLIVSDYSPVMGYGSGPGSLFVGFRPELNLPG
jgi:DegV family protein with EDD domain